MPTEVEFIEPPVISYFDLFFLTASTSLVNMVINNSTVKQNCLTVSFISRRIYVFVVCVGVNQPTQRKWIFRKEDKISLKMFMNNAYMVKLKQSKKKNNRIANNISS